MNGDGSSPPSHPRVDDKAAQLEVELERLLKRTDNGKFIGCFALAIIGLSVVAHYVSWYAFTLIFVLALVFLISLAFHWRFPEIVRPLTYVMNWVMRMKLGDPNKNKPLSPDEED